MIHQQNGFRRLSSAAAPVVSAALAARIAWLRAERDRALARGDEAAAADLHARWAEHKATASAGRA